MSDADQEERQRGADGNVDAVLNGGEYRAQDRCDPDDELDRRDPPVLIYLAET